MRILLATWGGEHELYGAGQLAMRFADCLQKAGADVLPWHPPDLGKLPWWKRQHQGRKLLREYVANAEHFDVIDCPADMISEFKQHRGLVVVRSIQPQLHYTLIETVDMWRRNGFAFRQLLRSGAGTVYSIYESIFYIYGLASADRILCLGNIEFQFYWRYCPWWRKKLWKQWLCPSAEERGEFSKLRTGRECPGSSRVLWMGRWAAHKGPRILEQHLHALLQAGVAQQITVAGFHHLDYLEMDKRLLASNKITLIPQFSRHELLELLSNHDIGLFTSTSEGWGLVLNEMLESGLTVYATDAGGVADLKEFFPNQLRKLPKPGARLEAVAPEPDLKDYYSRFSWEAIGQYYLTMCGDCRRHSSTS